MRTIGFESAKNFLAVVSLSNLARRGMPYFRKRLTGIVLASVLFQCWAPQLWAESIPLREITANEFLFRDRHIQDLDYALYGWIDTYPGQNQIVQKFFDGWASDYGDGPGGSDPAMCPCGPIVLPGGTFFDTDLFQLGYTNIIDVWWDFTTSTMSL